MAKALLKMGGRCHCLRTVFNSCICCERL